MNLSTKHPIILDGKYEVSTLDLSDEKEFLNQVDISCPDKKHEILEDVFPYWIVYNVLAVIGEKDKMCHFNNDDKFKEQVRAALSTLDVKAVNYIRKYVAERNVKNLFFQNVPFNKDMEEFLGLPDEIVYGSEEYQIWNNFIHCAAQKHIEIRDCINMTNNEHLSRYREQLIRASGEKRLEEIHSETTEEYNKIIALIEAEKLKKAFPKWEGKTPEGIRFIKNGEELLQEGQTMHHCVASYVDICLAGKSYIFHVEDGKHHATLELTKDGRIKQFASFHNQPVAPALRDKVDAWLKEVK